MHTPRVILILIACFGLLATVSGHAAITGMAGLGQPEVLYLTKGKSRVVATDRPVKRVSLAEPNTADILVMSETQIYLTGKNVGSTNLTLWDRNDVIMAVYDVIIVPDMGEIKHALHQVLPHEQGIAVTQVADKLTLSGNVSSAMSLDKAVPVANAFAGEEGINNFLTVGGVHQVMLEVRFAEMSRELLRKLGVNFNYVFDGTNMDNPGTSALNGDNFYSQLDKLTFFNENAEFTVADDTNIFGTIPFGLTNIGLALAALKDNGLAKVLAEPNLVCLSGKEANFLAGGEIPIPVPQGLGTVAVEYKRFGVGLNFKPIVLAGGRIHMEVQPQVSELDFSNALEIAGTVVPAFRLREVNTTLELEAGQSFAIAGLIQDNLREASRRYPFLGDLPVLGTLFRSNDFQQQETELIVIVTVRLVKPLDLAQQTLPTDGFEEPSDFEFYFLGRLQSARSRKQFLEPASYAAPTPGRPGFDGDFGHSLPTTDQRGGVQ
jgi:pilus assembly protein CpaC